MLAFALTTKWPARHLHKIRQNRVFEASRPYTSPAFSKVPPEPPSKVGRGSSDIEMSVTQVTVVLLALWILSLLEVGGFTETC